MIFPARTLAKRSRDRVLAIILSAFLAGAVNAQQPAPVAGGQDAPNAGAQQPIPVTNSQQPATNAGAQQPAPAASTLVPSKLKVLVLGRDGAANNVLTPGTTTPVVEVRDENDRPVEGARVEFQLPLTGPSGSFEGGARNLDVMTNAQGQASAPYTPNTELGRFTIQVKATLGPQSGSATILQKNTNQNEPVEGRSWISTHKKLLIIGGIVVAGGIVAAILATRGGGSSNTVTITPGVPTVGAPR